MKRLLMISMTGVCVLGLAGGCAKKNADASLTDMEPVAQIEPLEPWGEPVADTMAGGPIQPMAIDATADRRHTVQRGETLWSIATHIYGNGQRWRDIQSANPGIQPTALRVGQELVIP